MDWVPGWDLGCAPDGRKGLSSVNNLLFLCALDSAIKLENAFGNPHMAAYVNELKTSIAASLQKKFWSQSRGMFADDISQTKWSEHAQCLAILSNAFPDTITQQCLKNLLMANDLSKTTVYFSYYLFEAFRKMGQTELILDRLSFWKNLVSLGMKTPVEQPEPSRSDCHAWGSHPLFHFHASIAGIRPDSPGFTTVAIHPHPGTLSVIESTLPHPDGSIKFQMKKDKNGWKVSVKLPQRLSGYLQWNGKKYQLSGKEEFKGDLPL